MRKLYIAAALLASTAAMSSPAMAADTAAQISALQEQLHALQQQLDALQASQAEAKRTFDAEVAAREEAEKEVQEAILAEGGKVVFADGKSKAIPAKSTKVTLKGGPTIESGDGKFKFKLGGRMHLDAATYDQDGVEMNSGFVFRRAGLAVEATLFKDWVFKAQYDFAENAVGFADVYLRFQGFDGVKITAGQFKMPFSLEELTSSNNITFMESSLPTVFAASRRIGLGVDFQRSNYTVAAAVYGRNVGQATVGDDRVAIGGRVTYAPINEKGRLLHLGAGVAYERTDDANAVRIQQRPESRVDGQPLIDTGIIANASSQFKYGLELAGVYGPFSLQGEYMGSRVNRMSTLSSLNFDGYYVAGSWILTGESRSYKSGAFNGVKPGGDAGAVELAVRYSALDLNDGLVTGGKMENLTIGTNWYINPYVRMMFNYVHVNNDALGPRADDPNIYQLRLQANF